MAMIRATNIPPQRIDFDAASLIKAIGMGPHRLIPVDCQQATLVVETDEPVKLVMTCVCDIETIRELAPDLANKFDQAI